MITLDYFWMYFMKAERQMTAVLCARVCRSV